MKKSEIKGNIEVIKSIVTTYKIFVNRTSKNDVIVKEKLMLEMIDKSCILFEASIYWLRKYRPTTSTLNLDSLLDELLNARFYGKIGVENCIKIEKGIIFLEREIFNMVR